MAHANALHLDVSILKRQGERPVKSFSARARAIRFGLMSAEMHKIGAHVLCLGHTQNDINEVHAMRTEGSNVGTPLEWSPFPLWPEGRGIMCFRPLLNLGRDTVKTYLRQKNIEWINDPANDSGQTLRSRVRRELREAALVTPIVTPMNSASEIDSAVV
jgi:tRNA(Ile)-lysidine synthase